MIDYKIVNLINFFILIYLIYFVVKTFRKYNFILDKIMETKGIKYSELLVKDLYSILNINENFLN